MDKLTRVQESFRPYGVSYNSITRLAFGAAHVLRVQNILVPRPVCICMNRGAAPVSVFPKQIWRASRAAEKRGIAEGQRNKKQSRFQRSAPRLTLFVPFCLLRAAASTRGTLADSANDERIGMDYHIQAVTKDDKLRILKFLRRFFFRDEPLNHSIELIPESEDSTCIELEEYCSMSSLENNLSLMAVSTSGAIVGVLLNGKMDPPCDEEPEYVAACENPKFQKILRLLNYVDRNVNRDGKFRGLNILEIRIISVDCNWRGKGVAKALVEKALEIGKEKGFHIARADCSSFFSGKLCARLGFEPIYELNYADYVDEDGNPIFCPAFPHTAIITYIKKL